MPGSVASLQAFRSRRTAGAHCDGPPPAPARGAAPGAVAAECRPMAAEPALEAEQAARFRALALPQLDAAYNLARHLARDADAASDIVQDAYLRALRGFAGYRGGDPRAWILQIVRNRFYDWARERRLDRTAPLPTGEDEPEDGAGSDLPDAEGVTPEEALAGSEAAASVRAAVAALPAPFRETLVLREMEELSYREIAAVTGVPLGTVMSRLARARQMFGEAWRRLATGQGGPGR